MSTIHKRRNGRPLASVSNNQAIRSPHGAIDIVGEVGGVMDGGEHTGLHLFLFHILPGQQKNIEGGGGHHSYNILLLTWVLQADLHILCQKTNEPLSLHFHTEEEKNSLKISILQLHFHKCKWKRTQVFEFWPVDLSCVGLEEGCYFWWNCYDSSFSQSTTTGCFS